MDSPWHMKCDSTFQPSTPAMVISASQVPKTQMEMNAGHCFYPRVAHDLRSRSVRGTQEPVCPSFLHSNNHGFGGVDAGSSFLALLSSPVSLLQCDVQLSDPNPCVISGNFPAASGNFIVDSVGSGTFLTSSGELRTENFSCHNPQTREDAFPAIISRAMAGLSSNINSVFHHIQSANTAVQSTAPDNEKAREPLSSRGQSRGTSSASNLNNCSSGKRAMPKMSLEGTCSKQATSFMNECPRVFCMDKSGYLLLSNTGLLGIVCSCHCCHMSVLKFCEHSGLPGVNPGDAVHMESGETIAQWRKLYFLKFGIRSPGDESEWDWPEVLSTTASLMKSNAYVSNISKNGLSPFFNSSEVILRSGKSSDNVVFPKNAHTDHSLFIDALSKRQRPTIQDVCNFPLEGCTGISQSNLHDQLDSQIMEHNLATYKTAPNFVGTRQDDGCQSTLKRNENSSIVHSPLQNPTSIPKELGFSVNCNSKDGLVGRNATSSNIELRLGQPPQIGNSVLSVIEPQLFDALVGPPKLQPLKQMIYNNADSHSREEDFRNNFCYAAGPSNSKMVEEQTQLKLRNYMSGISNALGGAAARVETDIMTNGLPFSPFPHFISQSEGSAKANEILVNEGLAMPKVLHSGSSGMQLNPTNVPWNSNDCMARQLSNSAQGSSKYLDKNKGVSCAKDSHSKMDSEFRNSKLMANPSSFTIAVGAGSDSCSSAQNTKNYELHHDLSMLLDASVSTHFAYGPKKVYSLGQCNHVTLGSLGTQLSSGISMPPEGISMGFPCFVSTPISNQTPTPLQQEGINMDTYLLDENMRLLALTQILELSKQQHAMHLHEMNQKQGKSSNVSQVQQCIEASKSKQIVSEATLKLPLNSGSCGNHRITGRNSYCHVSALAPTPLHSKETDLQCKHSYDLLQNVEPSLSLGRSEGITRSSECDKYSEKPSETHLVARLNRATQVNCSRSNFMLGVGSSRYALRQKIANTDNETSLMIASKDENLPFQQGGKLDGQDPSKMGSHTPQWRDVPSKVEKGVSDAKSLDQLATALDWQGQDGDQLGNIPAKRFKRTIHKEDSFKEQEISNVSSGCSALVISQVSVEDNNVDSSTVDAGDTAYVGNVVVDEGSGIDKGWSSDALESERSAELIGSTCEIYLKQDYLGVSKDQPCRSLLDELRLLDSLTWKKDRDRNHILLSVNCKSSQSQKGKKHFKGKKRKRMELRKLDVPFSPEIPSLLHNENGEKTGVVNSPYSLSKELQMYLAADQQRPATGASFVEPNTKHRISAISSKFLSCKSHLGKHHSDREGQDSFESESDSDADYSKFPEVSGRKKLRKNFASDVFKKFQMQEAVHEKPQNAPLKSFSSRQVKADGTTRPIVCGNYGEISTGKLAGVVPKPAKIVSLSDILKTSRKCGVPTNSKSTLASKGKWKKLCTRTNNAHCCGHYGLKTKEDNGAQNTVVCDQPNVDTATEDLKMVNKPLVSCQVNQVGKAKQGDSIVDRAGAPLKLKCKEIRKRSIYELTAEETKVKKILEYAEDRKHGLCNTNSKEPIQEHRTASILDSDAFCCVCQGSSKDENNCLLECSRCLIRVHQACYGISTLPKGRWCCRPCRTNSNDIACVLCGYGGGAMTRALRSGLIVKSLLKFWNIEKEGACEHATPREGSQKPMNAFFSSKSGLEGDQIGTSTTDLWTFETKRRMQHIPHSVSNLKVHNSITAGVLDANVKQWLHMVCGLWTPGTRCPNVDTMSAFDVSSVSRPRPDVVCSICNRGGGSCIECRIVSCSVKFHAWCAHQKGLLQSETEGVDDEKVGFYGTCVFHAIDPGFQSKQDPISSEMGCLEEKEFTCARTEGYKGRRWDGFRQNHYGASKDKGGCLVPQEQLNAWIHINGQKLCSLGLPKFPTSDIEYDCRKEYARYKQAKGWKHLVVYKSGIHALGLYTSRFISRGQMVVEYVGEIVGLRVADKRENEYQSGRKLQYKSACYFFRIDKEYIIDATRKGGIARFVNHSCLPNCVAKVITIRHEKKVVFFAERDIFPGEEITYDYHFNHEDEGKKIPCYCNSKNCRRYLN